MDALAGLLEERTRYEGWLAQLESHRSQVPAHVVDRVRSDYQERLQGVIDQLRSRESDLQSSAAQMDQRIATLLSEETERRDERAEGELRAAVGEFTAEYARDLLARCDEAIGRLSAERNGVASELARVQEILAAIRRPVAIPRAPQPPAATPASAPNVPSAAPGAPARATMDSGSYDELAFLQSVVEPRPAEPISEPVAPAAPAAARRSEPATAEHAAPTPGTRIFASTPDDLPAFLKDPPTEQAKTLKCQECGTMNFATEWYCERCGGELAAM
jgi:hypothetical protein